MSQQNEHGHKVLAAAAALTAWTRLKVDTSGLWATSGAGEPTDAIAQNNYASGDHATGRMLNCPGTFKVLMGTSCSIGSTLYAAASGKFSTVALGLPQMKAMQAATGDGAVIEARPLQPGEAVSIGFSEAHTADDTLLAGEMYGHYHSTVGAGGSVTLIAPAAVPGMHATFFVGAAQNLVFEPNASETVALPATGVQQANITANAAGEFVNVRCYVAGIWEVTSYGGTWT